MQYLAIQIETKSGAWAYLDLDDKTSITIREKSPLFSESVIPSLASFTATLPVSLHNQQVFENANLIAAGYKSRWESSYKARLYICGQLWRVLVLTLKSGVTAKRMPFVLDTLQKFNFEGVLLRDIPFEDFNIGADTAAIIDHMKDTTLGTFRTFSHVFFPLVNFNIDGQLTLLPRINNWNASIQEFYFNDNTTYTRYFISPYFYLFWVIQRGLELSNFIASGDFFQDEELGTLAFYNNATLDELIEDVPTDLPINIFSGDVSTINHLPEMTFSQMLADTQQMFGVAIIWKNDNVFFRLKKNIINSTNIKDWTKKAIPDYKLSPLGQDNRKCWYDDSTDARWIVINDRPVEILDSGTFVFLNMYLEAQYVGQIVFETNTQTYYRIFSDLDDNADPTSVIYGYSVLSKDYFCTEDIITEDINTVNISPLLGIGFSSPEISNPIKSIVYPESLENEFGARLTFYRGYLNTVPPRPYASSRADDPIVPPFTANYALNWNGEKGLFNQFLKAWYNATKEGEIVEKLVKLEVEDLIDWDWTQKIRLYEEGVAHHTYLPYEYSITLRTDCLRVAKVKLVKLC